MKAQRHKCGGRILLGNNTAGRSCCGLSGSRVLKFGFQQDSIVYTCTVDHMYTQFRIAQSSTCAGPFGNASISSSGNKPVAIWSTYRQCYQYPQVFVVFLRPLGEHHQYTCLHYTMTKFLPTLTYSNTGSLSRTLPRHTFALKQRR